MSQLSKFATSSGPGSGTVTSISAGTGITLTPNPITTTGTVALTIPVVVSSGGTGDTSFTAYAPIVGGTTTTGALQQATTGIGNSGYVLMSNGSSAIPSFQNVSAGGAVTIVNADSGSASPTSGAILISGGTTGLTTIASGSTLNVTGTLKIANGGTNATSMANTDGVVYYDGTRLVTTTVGTATQVLTSNGAGLAPTFQTAATSGITTINGDSGSVTGSTVTINGNGSTNAGATVKFSGSGTTLTLNTTMQMTIL